MNTQVREKMGMYKAGRMNTMRQSPTIIISGSISPASLITVYSSKTFVIIYLYRNYSNKK